MTRTPRSARSSAWAAVAAALLVGACSKQNGVAPADGGSGDAGAGDAGPGDAGSSFDAGAPITAPANQWTWVPFSDAQCADGSTVGIGINPNPGSSQLLIYLEGGGACWSELTCYTLMTASYFTTGYAEADFNAESTDATYLAQPGGFFDRTTSANPFQNASFVYVPYCTGDVHSGANIATYGSNTAHHVGYQNLTAFLERVVPTFPNVSRVFLAGSSAGGLGAAINWFQTQQAFGSTRVDLIDDSGPFMPADVLAGNAQESLWRTQWDLAATLPAGCTGCATSLSALYSYYAGLYPQHRAALLSYTQDTVVPTYYEISNAQFQTGLTELVGGAFTSDPNFKSFTVNASGHVLWFNPTLASNGVTLQSFLSLMVTDSASWSSENP